MDIPQLRDLSFRARKILYAVVTEYVATGEPVGSRKLARRYGLNLSPASIRNVLADLEDWGLLYQPHTSAGRVPTDVGFRLFVDALVHMREVSAEDRHAILNKLSELNDSPHLARGTGRLLSTLTGAATLISGPRTGDEKLTQLRFMPLDKERVLVVVVTRGGHVQNRVIRPTEAFDPSELEMLHNYLAEVGVAGRSLSELRSALAGETDGQRGTYDRLRARAKALVDNALEAEPETRQVVVEGTEVLFDRPEFDSSEKIRAFLRAFEAKERLLELVDSTIAARGVQVLIGVEAQIDGINDVSVIGASYGDGGGSVAVIGPTRMDYGKVVPLVEFTARAMGKRYDTDQDDQK